MTSSISSRGWLFATALMLVVGSFSPLGAQDQPGKPRGKQPSKAQDEELKFRLETITTKDGVPLMCGFFPSDRGKEAVPVILIHEWKGSAPPYVPLAQALNKAGCAVITPDLRGHGGSRTYTDPRGQTKQFGDVSRMGRRDVQAMLSRDMEAIKGFLKDQNDEGKLNLNALTLVGMGEGAVVATNFAVIDWNFPDIGVHKQSKDVKALVLVSPERVLHGFTSDLASRHPVVSRLPWLVIAGEQSQQAEEAERLYRQLERLRRSNPAVGAAELKLPPTSFSNARLVRESKETIPLIVDFVNKNVIDKQEMFPWEHRSE